MNSSYKVFLATLFACLALSACVSGPEIEPAKVKFRLVYEGFRDYHVLAYGEAKDVKIEGNEDAQFLRDPKVLTVVAGEEMHVICAQSYIWFRRGLSSGVYIDCPGPLTIKYISIDKGEPGTSSFDDVKQDVEQDVPDGKIPYYSEKFVLMDKHNGMPMIYTNYRIETEDGMIIRGVSNNEGGTLRVFSYIAQKLNLLIE